ncbi:MAG TPA: 50S ribosomal protein L13 [Patescibacteria group bacterium]|nr:50S ribosomal protein L13 [Patescibacteria group bacterium]
MIGITKPTKTAEISRAWHLIDVKGKTLGRVSTEIAQLLMGKSKPYFAKNLDCGDYVVVINAKEVAVTGKKEREKVYTRYSGYPGGLRSTPLMEMRDQKPEEIVRHAVSGMIPKNKLRASMLKRLYVSAGTEHKFADKLEGGVKE